MRHSREQVIQRTIQEFALQGAPEKWFSGRERGPDWPQDLVGHSAYHRVNDIERALQNPEK